MADPQQYQFLLDTLKEPGGRKRWIEFKLKNQWIDLSTADFTSRRLHDYDLSEANLSTAIFVDVNLSGADLSDAQLEYADLRRANLRGAVLDRANLNAANLKDARLTDACLEGARLHRTKLAGANLTGADLSGADLSGADLSGACLKFARCNGTNLTGANVAHADLTGAILDDDAPRQMANFDEAIVDDRSYREMRSRITLSGPMAVESAGPVVRVTGKKDNGAKPGNNAKPAPESAKPAPDKPKKEEKAPKEKANRRWNDPQPGSAAIPERQEEPDLTTVEGCCRILDVSTQAPLAEVVKAFREKAKIFHPDKVLHLSPRLQELAAEEFRRLRQAYEFLTRRTARPLVGIQWPEAMARRSNPYEYSVAEYEELVRLNPADTNILYNLAWKYFEQERFAEALAGFQRVLTLNPKDDDAYFNVIVVRLYSEILLPHLGANS